MKIICPFPYIAISSTIVLIAECQQQYWHSQTIQIHVALNKILRDTNQIKQVFSFELPISIYKNYMGFNTEWFPDKRLFHSNGIVRIHKPCKFKWLPMKTVLRYTIRFSSYQVILGVKTHTNSSSYQL